MNEQSRLDAQATDAIGRVWLLLIRVDGPASIWRIGEKVAEMPWTSVQRTIRETSSSERAAEAILTSLANRAEGLVPGEMIKEFTRPVAAWIDGHRKHDSARRFA